MLRYYDLWNGTELKPERERRQSDLELPDGGPRLWRDPRDRRPTVAELKTFLSRDGNALPKATPELLP